MIRKILKYLIVGSLTTLISACYGVIIDFQEHFLRRIKVRDTDGTPIPGLIVTLTDDINPIVLAAEETDEAGEANLSFEYYPGESYKDLDLRVEDVDGQQNGGEFEPFEGDLGNEDPRIITLRQTADE